MDKIFRITSLICASFLTLALGGCTDDIGDKYVMFSKCLTRKEIKMYGTYWCPHCQNQKDMFGPQGFKEVIYVECDARGENAKPQECLKANITGYPTWIFPDGSRLFGEVSLERLAEKSGCELPRENGNGTTTN